MAEKRLVRISVRNLVEFVLRSGDIDNRHSASAQKEAMLAGGRIHRKIQKRMGANYRAEVPLKFSVEDDEQEITLLVEGRADGIMEEDGIVT
ncbi:MAG: ATP-dependent DNA helicase, partial [Lachnospiraceae bacterium]|nr:ATP-dependent DNA helicase [Lachnospiraceae bacterium]